MPDLLDQRAIVYRLANVGAGGFVASQWQPVATVWCRAEAASGMAQFVAAQRGETLDAMLSFGDDVDVRPTDVVIADDQVQYLIDAVTSARLLRRIRAKASVSSNQILPRADAPCAALGGIPASVTLPHGTAVTWQLLPTDTQSLLLPGKRVTLTLPTAGVATLTLVGYALTLTGVAIGSATCAATVDGVTASCVVTVT